MLERLRRWWNSGHLHDWDYGERGIGGWGVVRCTICGETDLY